MIGIFIKKFQISKQLFIAFFVATTTVLYFSYYMIFGPKGVFEYYNLKSQIREKEHKKSKLQNQKKHQQNIVNGMNSKSLDLDLLDEQVKNNLGYAKENEIIIYKNK